MKSNLFKFKLLLENLINVSGNKQKKKSLEQLFKKCPNADFTGFPLHLTVPSVPSQVGLAMGTPEVFVTVTEELMALLLGPGNCRENKGGTGAASPSKPPHQ